MTAATGGRMGRRRSRFDAQRIAAAERQRRALGWRGQGYTYQQIADAAGYKSKQAAHKAVTSALRNSRPMRARALELARSLELRRVDQLFSAIYPMACRGDIAAVAAALELMALRARLLGLDAPEQSRLLVAVHYADFPTLLVNHINPGIYEPHQ